MKLTLPNGTRWPVPLNDDERAALTSIMPNGGTVDVTLTYTEAARIASIVDAYEHLAAHPAGTESAVKDLRMLRRALNVYYAQPRSNDGTPPG